MLSAHIQAACRMHGELGLSKLGVCMQCLQATSKGTGDVIPVVPMRTAVTTAVGTRADVLT